MVVFSKTSFPEKVFSYVLAAGIDLQRFENYWKTLTEQEKSYKEEELISDYLEEVYYGVKFPSRFDLFIFLKHAGFEESMTESIKNKFEGLSKFDSRRVMNPLEFTMSVIKEKKDFQIEKNNVEQLFIKEK